MREVCRMVPPVRSIPRVLLRSRVRRYSESSCRSLPEVGQPFPAAANSQDFIIHVRRLIDDALDDGVQAGNISTAG